MIRSRLLLSTPFLVLTSTAFAQVYSPASSPRSTGAGVGAIALENEAGKGALFGTTAGAAKGVKVGAGYTQSTVEIKVDGSDFSATLTQSGLQLHAIMPIQDTVAIGVAATSTASSTDYDDDEFSTQTDDSSKDSFVELFGSYSTGSLTAGLGVEMHGVEDEYEETYLDSGTRVLEDSSSKGNTTRFTLGFAFRPTETTRLALQYRPKAVEKYKGDRKTTETDTTSGASTVREGDDPNVLVENESVAVGVAHDFGRAKLVGGIARDISYDEEYEITTTTGSSSGGDTSSGSTMVSVGSEFSISPSITGRGHIHNIASKDLGGIGFAIGADFLAGPVEISPALAYSNLEADDDSDLEATYTSLQLGVGATF